MAAETIPFYCEGYGELVEQARALVTLTAPDTCMRAAAEAAIEDRDACVKRHEEIGALRDAAAACVEARAGLEARAVGQPPTGLEGYAAWSADCAAAEARWRAIEDDPDTWQPHLDRLSGDAEKIEADLGRLAGLRGLDAAWSDLLEERPAIAEEARARGCDAFDLDRWDGFVEKARALAEWPDLPEAAAEAAARVLDYDAAAGRCGTSPPASGRMASAATRWKRRRRSGGRKIPEPRLPILPGTRRCRRLPGSWCKRGKRSRPTRRDTPPIWPACRAGARGSPPRSTASTGTARSTASST